MICRAPFHHGEAIPKDHFETSFLPPLYAYFQRLGPLILASPYNIEAT